jgi:tape measure domain-containing protein
MAKGDILVNIKSKADASGLQDLLDQATSLSDEMRKRLNAALGGEVVKKFVIETRTNTSGVRKIVLAEKEVLTILDQVIARKNQLEKIERGSVTSLRQQVNEAKQARDQIAKYSTGVGLLGGRVNAVNDRWVDQNKKVQGLQRSLDVAGASGFWERAKVGLNAGGLISFGNSLTQVTSGLQSASIVVGQITGSINNLVNSLSNLQSFALTFEAIGAGAAGGTFALDEASRIALNLGSSLTSAREGFQQLTPVILNSGGTIQDVSAIIESLSSRFAVYGLNSDKARRVTNGIIQAFAKGKLQAEEFTQQIAEADSAFGTDFAKALRVTTAELQELIKAGEITSDVILRTLPKISKSSLIYGKLGSSAADAVVELEKGNVTFDQVKNKIQSLAQLNLESFSELLKPILFAFTGIGAAIVDFTTDILKLESVKAVATTFSGLIQALERAVSSFLALSKAALTVIEPIAKLANALLSIPGAAEALGFSILGRLIAPLGSLKKSFNDSQFAASGFGRVISRATDFQAFSKGIRNFATGNKAAQSELTRTSRSVQTFSRAGSLLQGNIAVINRELAVLRNRQATLKGGGFLGTALPGEVDRVKKSIADLSGTLARNEAALVRAQGGFETTSSRLASLSASGAAAQGILGRTAGVFSGIGRAAVAGFGAAAGAVGGLFAALGPLGIALAAIAVTQAAYASANRESFREIERTKGALKAYSELIKELSGEEAKPPRLEGLERVWVAFSLKVANAIDSIKEPLDRNAENVNNWASSIPASLNNVKEKLKILPVFQGIFGSLDAIFNNSAVEAELFARGFEQSINGIGQEAEVIEQATVALKKLAAESDGTTDSQVRLSAKFRTQLALIQATEERYKSARSRLEEYNKSLGESPTEEQQIEIAKLKRLLAEAEARLKAATAGFKEFGDQSGLTAQEIQKSIFSIGALSEDLKKLREDLEKAAPGSKVFTDLAVDIAALEAGLDVLSSKAKDPVELLASIPGRIKERTRELNKLLLEQAELLEKVSEQESLEPQEQDSNLLESSKARLLEISKLVDQLGVKLDNLSLLDAKIKVQLAVESQQFKNELSKISNDIQLTTINAKIAIDQPALRAAITQVTEFRNTINDLFGQQQVIQQQLQGNIPLGERLALVKQEALLVAQIEAAALKGGTELRDAGITLREQLVEAGRSLLDLKLGNLDFLPIEQQREAIQQLNAEVQKIAEQRGIKAVFEGTPEEILRAKQAFVSFYRDLQKGEKSAQDVEGALGLIEKIAKKLQDSGLQGVFEGLDSATFALADSTALAAGEAENISTSLGKAAVQATNIVNAITGLDGLTVSVNVLGIPGRWTGGPTQAGQAYQVNELGQEGFLSAGGSLRPINKPKNALWRAPSSGTVIPAHIWSGLNVPTGGVRTNTRPMAAGSGGNGLQRVVRAIQSSLTQPRESNQAMHELTAVQARQAIEIGKLSRAVNKLADKDQSVNVSVRGNDATAYLGALNSRM